MRNSLAQLTRGLDLCSRNPRAPCYTKVKARRRAAQVHSHGVLITVRLCLRIARQACTCMKCGMSRALAGISSRRLPFRADTWHKDLPQRGFKQFLHHQQSLGLISLPYDGQLSCSKVLRQRNWQCQSSSYTTLAQHGTAEDPLAAGCVAPPGMSHAYALYLEVQ